jgi:hypothetical protein
MTGVRIMLDGTVKDRGHQKPPAKGLSGILKSNGSESEDIEDSLRAFAYLRGIRDRAAAVEFRFLNGNSIWFPYAWLGTCHFNPSEGLLIKFSGDLVYLVLIKGSNLDHPLPDTNTNLTSSGLQRHRVVWMREMSREEICHVGEAGPTIDSIEVAEFESHAALREWLDQKAPSFARGF